RHLQSAVLGGRRNNLVRRGARARSSLAPLAVSRILPDFAARRGCRRANPAADVGAVSVQLGRGRAHAASSMAASLAAIRTPGESARPPRLRLPDSRVAEYAQYVRQRHELAVVSRA